MESAPPRLIRRALLLCTLPVLLLHAACDSVETVEVAAPGAPLEVGSTFQMTAQAKGRSGDILTNRAVSWSSSVPGVAAVDGAGLVTALAPGNATISATIEGKTGSASVSVVPRPVASIQISPPNPSVEVGATVQLTATLRDAGGNILTDRTVTWSSGNNAVASVNPSGLVLGVAAGNTSITAAAEGRSASVQLAVTGGASGNVTLSGISPNPLVEGQSATLTGSGFSSTAGSNQVTVGGVPATVTAATATELQITVPSACQPEGNAEVRVTVGTQQSNALQHPFRPSQFLNVPVGQQLILRNPAPHCLQFQPSNGSEAYLIGVQSTSEVVSSLTPLTVQTVASPVPAGAPASFGLPLPLEATAQPGPRPSTALVARAQATRPAGHAEVEQRIRQFEREFLGPRLRELQARAPRGELQPQSLLSQNPQVGQTVEMRVPNIHPGKNGCTEFIPVQATVRVVGQRGIWLEDQSNPAGGFTAADFQSLSDYFDTQVYATITGYFGAPTDIDNNQKILILATKEVNRAGPAGFVISSDFFPRSQQGCASSNVAEIYYSEVPDPTGLHGPQRSRDVVLGRQSTVMAHEFVHIIQFGLRIFLPGVQSLASVWELEGQATLGEEIMGHAQSNRQPGQNYGASVIFNNPQTSPRAWYLGAFTGVAEYFGWRGQNPKAQNAPEQCSWLGRPEAQAGSPCTGGQLPYGTAWSFLRWLSDHHGARFPGGERGLHQALIRHPHSGYRTIEEVIGRPIHELLAQWAAMLYVDDRVPGAQTSLTLPSWNLVSFEQAMTGANATGRLEPGQLSFVTSAPVSVSVRAASTAYFRISGPGRPGTAVRIRDNAGNPLPTHMQVWIVRLQ